MAPIPTRAGITAFVSLAAVLAPAAGHADASASPTVAAQAEGSAAPSRPMATATFTGWLLPTFAGSSAQLSSLGLPNQQAATAAYPTIAAPGGTSWRSRFAASQARIGANITVGEAITGAFELDFIDLALSAPTTAARPRLRRAQITWALAPDTQLLAGQDWDLFSPGKPFTYNFVGLFFQAGNVGFMRHQLRLTHQVNSRIEVAAAVASAGVNNLPGEGALERGGLPLGELRATWTPEPGRRVGVAALAGAQGYGRGVGLVRRAVLGANLFAEATRGPLEAVAEAYWGRNLADSGALAIANGGVAASGVEVGGYASARVRLTDPWAVHAGLGIARCLSDRHVAGFDANNAAAGVTSILRNIAGKAGSSLKLAEGLEVFGEYSLYATRYAFAERPRQFLAHAAEVGMFLRF